MTTKRRWCSWLLLFALLPAACGGAAAATTEVATTEATHAERIRRGLELADRKDFVGALSEFQVVQREAPSVEGSLRLANARFQLGRHAEALAGYRNYLENGQGLFAQERMALSTEIGRIEKALDDDRKPEGPSLASQWFQGELARLRADDALAADDFEEARAGYDIAFGYLGYPGYLFEAAIAASLNGEIHGAHDRFADYLRLGGPHIPPERAFAVAAEVDRLAAIMRGEPPITEESLATRVLAERAGTEEPEAPPPSATDVAPPAPEPAPEPKIEPAPKPAPEPKIEPAPKPAPEPVPTVEEQPYRQVEVPPETAVRPPPRTEPKPVPLEDLLFYCRSTSSAVRHRAVRNLARLHDDRARLALEERATRDGNMQIRFAAVAGLVARRSYASLPVLRRALITAATSEERGALKRAIAEIQQ
ncbi:MAG TPA: HEAT repeat domain-containing protein [Polyangia bacterium]|nr:HEAT repeat domain-containing protein [Polyangia bacterium]